MQKIDEFVINQVKKLRLRNNWSQQELADYMNLSRSFIRDVEDMRKETRYNIRHLNMLAHIFCIPFSYFFPDKPFDEEN